MNNNLLNLLKLLASKNLIEAEKIFSKYLENKSSLILNESTENQVFNLLNEWDLDKLYKLCSYFKILLPKNVNSTIIIRKIINCINTDELRISDIENYSRINNSEDVFTEENLPIKLLGNDVLINGKVVGTVNNDLKDPDSKIRFIDLKGNSKNFENIKELYQFLSKKFELSGGE